MISFLRGKLAKKNPTDLVIDVNGVGYALSIPLSTYEKLEQMSGEITILTYLHVREDILQLYGFATEAEREIFKLLISVSGIGPKMAQGILSGLSANEFKQAILDGNVIALTSISGVGKKTAERLIIELRDKLGKTEMTEFSSAPTSKLLKARAEAVVALMSLGYSRSDAEQAVRLVGNETEGKDLSIEQLIKGALRHTSK